MITYQEKISRSQNPTFKYYRYINMSKVKDLEFGLSAEEQLLSVVRSKYGEGICRTKDKSCRVDYCGDDILVELKSRRNTYDKYPTTMIGKGKIDYMLESGKKSVCLFNFTDGLYSIEIDKNKIDQFVLSKGGRFDRGRPELNMYYYIPTRMLEKV
jgi:hypothetical protein